MNGTSPSEEGTQEEIQSMDTTPESPVSPSPSSTGSSEDQDTMSDESGKGYDVISLESNSPMPLYIEQPEADGVSDCQVPMKKKPKLELPERVYSQGKSDSRFSAFLETADLWKQFDEIGTEMIVTRRGRRMFPPLKIQLLDLDPTASYVLLMDIAPCDEYRYKFQNYSWQQCFKEDCSVTRFYIHPDSPSLGARWMKSITSFYKLKLTNNQLDQLGNVIVNSMHKYQPRLHIVQATCTDVEILRHKEFHTIVFPGTQFMTVTAYQNDKITQLKINNNPFAKGFRHPFARVRPRSRYQSEQRYSSTGSESSADENNVSSLSVIQSGPNFSSSATIMDERAKNGVTLGNSLFHDSPLRGITSPPLLKSIPSVALSTSHTLTTTPSFVINQHRASKQQQFNAHSVLPGTIVHSKSDRFSENHNQPDPKSGQNFPVPSLLSSNTPSHYIMNSVVSVPVTNGTHEVDHTSPTLSSSPTIMQNPVMMINGSKYIVYVPPNGGPPSLVPMSTPVPNNPTAYTSPPIQLINSAPTASPKSAFQFPTKTESRTKTSLPTPPPLLSIGSVTSPPPTKPINNVKTMQSPSSDHEKRFVLLQSPPTTSQKLFILPVMTNSQIKNGTVFMPVEGSVTPSMFTKSTVSTDKQVLSAMPIYRFGNNTDGTHPVKFISTPHL